MKKHLPFLKIILLFILVPVIIYIAAISKTVKGVNEYRQIQKEIENVNSEIYTIKPIGNAPILSSGAIIGLLSKECKDLDVHVRHYLPTEIESEKDISLYSADILFSGRFVPLVKIMSYISQHIDGVRIMSCSFRIEENKGIPVSILMSISVMSIETNS